LVHIVFGCPIKNRAWIVPRWLESIHNQYLLADNDITYDILCILSPSDDNTEALLLGGGADVVYHLADGRPASAIVGHHWGDLASYTYMASLRNLLLDHAAARNPTYFFSWDSDILLPPATLEKLIECEQAQPGIYAPSVSMSQDGTHLNTMQWQARDRQGIPIQAHRTPPPRHTAQVDVIMAAMLIERRFFHVKWAPHPQGEDVGYSLNADRLSVPLYWVPEIRGTHIMRPDQ